MAQDLSQTIQEGLTQTLTNLLGVDAKFQETTRADKRDFKDIQLLQINTEFEFDKLSTILKFIIPSSTASIIFNTMIGATEYDISDTIDDDTTDAMGEFISNISGTLVTAFNAKEIDELGKAKFNIQHKEVFKNSSIENIDTIYRFSIKLDETPLTIFINFDEQFLPFIEEITKTEPTPYKEEETPALEEKSSKELSEENNTPQKKIPETKTLDPKSIITNDKKEKTSKEIDNKEITQEDEKVQKKAKKMKLFIIIISSLIILIIIAFLTFYLMSSDKEEIKQANQIEENKNKEKELKTTPNKTLKKINFNIKDIDIKRLNRRLATLTKYEILSKEELEVQKKEEKKRVEKLKKEEKLKEFAKLNKEEPIIQQKNPPSTQEIKQKIAKKVESHLNIIKNKKTAKKEPITQVTQQKKDNQLLFILTNSIKYTLFKSLVMKTNSSTARISMCNNTDGRTTILIGPFENKEQRNKINQLIKDSNENIKTTLSDLTLKEFNQKCNF